MLVALFQNINADIYPQQIVSTVILSHKMSGKYHTLGLFAEYMQKQKSLTINLNKITSQVSISFSHLFYQSTQDINIT